MTAGSLRCVRVGLLVFVVLGACESSSSRPAGAGEAARDAGSASAAGKSAGGAGGQAAAGPAIAAGSGVMSGRGVAAGDAAYPGEWDDAGTGQDDAGVGDSEATAPVVRFSFFVTSLRAMRELSGSQHGFGGDLRFSESGEGAGLRGADKICTTIAEQSLPGSGKKQWRAFLSATSGGPEGGPVHAIDRVGEGPWYDRLERLVSTNKADLMQVRPASADPVIKNDLPNEDGVPNHNPDGVEEVDNHDVLTGTGADGRLFADDPRVTCNDWTKSEGDSNDAPRVGHSWPRSRDSGSGEVRNQNAGRPRMGDNWMSALDEAGCGAGVAIVEMGPPDEDIPTVGSGGGYGGIYCFALSP